MVATEVAIVASGGANISSLRFALGRLGVNSVLTADPDVIRNASHVILPGVGAAADAMQSLKKQQLQSFIAELTQPVLGICLGMQLLAEHSEEHRTSCLGIVPAIARKLHGSTRRPVPNTGWCPIQVTRDHPLLHEIKNGSYFYFLHSYALPVCRFTLATAAHEKRFSAVLAYRNFVATQFHPERSSLAGARLLSNFLQLRR